MRLPVLAAPVRTSSANPVAGPRYDARRRPSSEVARSVQITVRGVRVNSPGCGFTLTGWGMMAIGPADCWARATEGIVAMRTATAIVKISRALRRLVMYRRSCLSSGSRPGGAHSTGDWRGVEGWSAHPLHDD